jgi:lipopolysaccharide transport system permease protein
VAVEISSGPGVPARLSAPTRIARVRAGLNEVLRARELTFNLVRRDLKVRHRGTFLGMLWSLTTPLMLVGLYYVIFKYILRASPAQDVPRPDHHAVPFVVYFFCGLTLWNFFANSLGAATGSVIGSGYLLRKVYFPRAILPLSSVLSSMVTFGFELAVLLVATLIFVGLPTWYVIWVPVLVAITAVLAYGLALFLSGVTVFLRDMAHFIGILLQVWFWGTPIIYSLRYVASQPKVVTLLKLNPMTGLVVSFRNVLILNHPPDVKLVAYDTAWAVVLFVIGAYLFHRWQRMFSEIV